MFDEHVNLFREQTDGLFSIEYTEEEFAERLYEAIGFLGGNFRYRDSDRFWNIRYFIQRYLTEQCLKLVLKFIHRCMEKLTGNTVEGVVVDTMGIDGRKKSILASFHGRYHTIGVTDLRAVKIVEDLGHLILYNVRKSIFPVYEICESVERSNHLKRKVRILEGSKARVEKHNVGLSLIATELVISIAGLYHMLNGWSGPESPFNLSDIRLYIPA